MLAMTMGISKLYTPRFDRAASYMGEHARAYRPVPVHSVAVAATLIILEKVVDSFQLLNLQIAICPSINSLSLSYCILCSFCFFSLSLFLSVSFLHIRWAWNSLQRHRNMKR